MVAFLFLIGLLILLWSLTALARQKVRRSAERLDRQIRLAFSPCHDYVVVRPEDFPSIDRTWYDRTAETLADLGFRRQADLEDRTVSTAFPLTRTFFRVMTAENDTVSAGFYQVTPTGPSFQWLKERGLDRLQVLDFQTEFDDGRFLCTSNAEIAASISVPADIIREVRPLDTPPAELLARHHERLALFQQGNPDVKALSLSTFQELTASANRQNALKAAHREDLGGSVTREEIRRTAGSHYREAGEALADEMDKLNKR